MALSLVTLPHPVTLEGRTVETLTAGRSVAELTAGMGDVAVAVDGRIVPPEGRGLVPRDGSVVAVRAAVAGGDTNPLRTVLQVALLVASIWVPGTAWFAALGRAAQVGVSAAILVGGSLVVNAIAPPRLPGLDRDGAGREPSYSLAGGANRARPYEPLLLVFGRHRVFPDLGGREYTVFQSAPRQAAGVGYTGADLSPGDSGYWALPRLARYRAAAPGTVDQYLYQILHFGLGDLDVTDLRLGDALLSDLEEVTTELSGTDGRVALVAGNVDTSAGAVLDGTGWTQRRSAARTVRIDLDFTGLIFQVDEDDGDIEGHSVAVMVEMWPDGDESAKRASTVNLRGSGSDQYRLTVPFEGLAEGVWVVRVRRAAAKSSDDLVHDDVAWAALRSYQADDGDYAGQVRLGVRARATGQLSGRLDRLSALVDQRIPVWDPDADAWTDPRASSNPAWLFRWYALGVWLEAGTYGGVRRERTLLAGAGIPPADVDDDALKRWGSWCDRHELTCDFVLDRDLAHAEVLALVAQCGRASPTFATGRLGVVFDEEGQAPSAFFGPGNIVAGTFEIDWIAGSTADEIVCRYIEPDADWQWNTVRRAVRGAAGRTRSATLTLHGVTSREQAAKACNLQAARQLYHRRRMRWRTGPEGLDVARGSVVHLSHALIDGGATGRALGGTADRPRLSVPIALGQRQGESDHLLFRLPDGRLHQAAASAPPGTDPPDDEVVLDPPLPEAPGAGGGGALDVLWRHYASGLPPVRAKVVSVEPRGAEEVVIEAIDEVEEYYAAATSDLTVDLPALTRSVPAVTRIEVAERLLTTSDGYAVELTAALTVQGDWRGGTVTASLDGEPARVVGRLDAQDLDATWLAPASGTVTIRAVPGSAAAPAGRALEATHEIAGPPSGQDAIRAGLAGFNASIHFAERQAAAGQIASLDDWAITASTEAWADVTALAFRANDGRAGMMARVRAGGLATLYRGPGTWADYEVRADPAVTGSGASRLATVTLRHIDGNGAPPASGALTLRLTLIGPKGDRGLRGLPGEEGDPGSPGLPGTSLLSGTTDPDSATGRDGDSYLNTDNGDIWRRSGGAWAKQMLNLSGADGSTWLAPGTAAPDNSAGQVGDFYLRTGDPVRFYRKTGAAEWSVVLSIADGNDANRWLSGNTAPLQSQGDPGDYYFQTSNGFVWFKDPDRSPPSQWVKEIDLTGPPGEAGAVTLSAYRVTEGGTVPNKPPQPAGAQFTAGVFSTTNGWVWPKPSYDPITQQLWVSESADLSAWSAVRLAEPISLTRPMYRRSTTKPDRPAPQPASRSA